MSKRKFRDDDEESRRKYLEQLLSSADDDEDEEEEPEEDDEDTLDDEDEEPAFDEGDESGDEPDGEDDEESDETDEEPVDESDEDAESEPDDEDEGETDEEGSDEPDDEDSEPDDEGDEGEGESDDEDETDEEPEPLPDEEDWEEDGEEEAGESDEDVDDDYEAEEPGYDKGTRVIVKDAGRAWLGTVTKVNKDGTLSIHFDNGDDEVHECSHILGEAQDKHYGDDIPMKLYKKYLKGAKKKDDSAPVIEWKDGMRVLVYLKDSDSIYLGTVSKVLGNKLKVTCDDGDVVTVNTTDIKGIGRQKPYKKDIPIDDIDKYRGETPDESNDDYVVNPAVEKALERVRELLERALEQQAAIKKDGPYQPSDFDSLTRKDKAAVLCLYGILSGTDDEKKVAYKKALKAGVKPKLPTF